MIDLGDTEHRSRLGASKLKSNGKNRCVASTFHVTSLGHQLTMGCRFRGALMHAAILIIFTVAMMVLSHSEAAFGQTPSPSSITSKVFATTGIKPERLISDDQIRSAISKITGVSDLEAERKDAPESAWFSRDRADIDAEISEHLDELSKTLGSSDAVRSWREMRDRQRELAAKRNEIDQLVQEAELSPSRRDEFRQKIDAARKEADALHERVIVAKRTAHDHVRKAGLDLTDAQLDALARASSPMTSWTW